jgi:hypothetical protein
VPWFGVGAVAALLAAAAIGFVWMGDGRLELAFPLAAPGAQADAGRDAIRAAHASVPLAPWHTAAEEELLAEIRRITARPVPPQVEYILALRRGGTRDTMLVQLTDALLGDDPLAAASVKGWLRRTPRPDPAPEP